ncbi:MAG: hypothetical protein ACP5I6_04815 [Caldisphaera sp.]|nr:hypothetical protein [Caldisphaera sp.]PMP59658.1 MAG: hypothetical protein C0201_04480 [Caldisphaera sp.]
MSDNQCKPNKDFMRNIVNNVLSELSVKIPVNVSEEIRKRIGYAEAKYKFSIYGGNPIKIKDYLLSEEWNDLVSFVKSLHLNDILKSILDRLYNEYNQSCPQVAEIAKNISDNLSMPQENKKENISIDNIINSLKLEGYQVESMENEVTFKDGNVLVRISLANGLFTYTICKDGKAQNLDSIIARVNKVKEI